MGFIVTPPAIAPIATKPEEVQFMSRFIFLNRLCARFRHQKSFVIKSEKIFDFFQFFFLNVGVDVIEIKDALFSSSHFIPFQ